MNKDSDSSRDNLSQIYPILSQNIPSICCDFCNMSFSTKGNLVRHQRKTCKQHADVTVVTDLSTHLKCKFCNTTFKHVSAFYRHKNTCKKRNMTDMEQMEDRHAAQINGLIKQIQKMNEQHAIQIKSLVKKVGTTNINNTINNNSNNTNNNILLPWNRSSTEHLTNDILKKCASRKRGCIPQLIEEKHFNTAVPENMNAYIPDDKNKYAKVFDGLQWNLEDKNRVVQELIEDNKQFFSEKIEEWKDERNAYYLKYWQIFERYLAIEDSEEYDNDLEHTVKLLLINKKDAVKPAGIPP